MSNKSAIYLLFASNIISGFAQGISMIAIPWYFVEIVDRPQFFMHSYFFITFLTLFWGLYAGTLIDRYSRKKIFILTNLISGIIVGLISFYGFQNLILKDSLVILVFGLTIFNYNIHYPNLYAFVQEITEKENYGRLNSYIEVQGQATSIFAGAIAAILLTGTKNNILEIAGIKIELPFNIKAWEIYEIFLVDSLTYLLVIILFSLIKYKSLFKNEVHLGSLYLRLQQGFVFLLQNRHIFIFGLISYVLFAFTLVEIHIILPSYVDNFLKMEGNVYASAEIYYSIGAILSGFLILKVFKNLDFVMSVILLFLIVSISLSLMTFYNLLWIFFLGNLVIGITNAGVRILRTTYLFNNVPNNLIGRTNSVLGTINIFMRMALIGILSLTFFQLESNIRFAYMIGCILLLFSVIILIKYYKYILSKSSSHF